MAINSQADPEDPTGSGRRMDGKRKTSRFLKCWDEILGLLCAFGLFFFPLKKPTTQNNLSDVKAVKSHREKHNHPCLLSLLLTHRHLYQNSSRSRNRKQRLIRRGKTHSKNATMEQWQCPRKECYTFWSRK